MRNNVNLYCDDHQLRYQSFYFPGGEPHVEIENPEVIRNSRAWIDARLGSMSDLGILLALTNAVQRYRPQRLSLCIPYFPGARQDREEPGRALTVRVYADLINAQKYDTVFVLDPHSAVTPALLERCVVLPHDSLVASFVAAGPSLDGLICPDAGAERRTLELAKHLGCDNIVFARKKRDPKTGALSGFSLDALPRNGAYLIADDLCDGGGTFVGLAQKFREDPAGASSLLYLWTTHGLFSKGVETLAPHFVRIGCSDSFPTLAAEHPQLQVLPILQDKDIFTTIRKGRK